MLFIIDYDKILIKNVINKMNGHWLSVSIFLFWIAAQISSDKMKYISRLVYGHTKFLKKFLSTSNLKFNYYITYL